MHDQKKLAWHETLEIHELVAFQAVGLINLKKAVGEVKDPELKNLYTECIRALENNLQELLKFYPFAPTRTHDSKSPDTAYYSGNLLGLTKTLVRNYSIAITETATPYLRDVLIKQLNAAIRLHADVFGFMYKKSYYPSYDLEKLLLNDVKNAEKALSM